jgi:hypothetical protein
MSQKFAKLLNWSEVLNGVCRKQFRELYACAPKTVSPRLIPAVGGVQVHGRQPLMGVHDVEVGSVSLWVWSREDLIA